MLPLLALASALMPPPIEAPFAPATPSPVVIAPDNVDLDGAGRLDFRPDEAVFAVDPPVGGHGLATTVRLWIDPAGKPVRCDIGQTPLAEAARTGCTQLLARAAFHFAPGFSQTLTRGFVDVNFGFFKPDAHYRRAITIANVYPGYTATTILYPTDDLPQDQHLTNADGRFTIAITPNDYPSVALRYGLEGRAVALMGIRRDGRVQTCRPLQSSGTAFLDNYTCALFAERGQFAFAPGAPAYAGLRYLRIPMNWLLPRD